MKKSDMGKTLDVQKPSGQFIYLVISMLIGYLLLGEILFSQDAVQKHLLGPRIGSRHRQFEVQFSRLEKLVKEGEQIDCIFLGNSMIWLDVNPLVVSQTFKSRTGREIHCFNFGVSALPASSAGLITPVLVERYHPKFLIYGTFARDYAIPASAEDASAVSDTPWLNYQHGAFDVAGWLREHSSFYQYKNYVPDLLSFNFGEVIPGYKGFPPYHDYGFDPKINIRIDVQKSPDPDDIGSKDAHKWLYQYKIWDENLEGLRQIVQQSEQGVEVIIIEMPFYTTAFEYFLNGKQDYNIYVEQVNQITMLGETQFWRVEGQPVISKEGWWDYFHMNIHGAQVFSDWLGSELGRLVLDKPQAPVSLRK